MTVPVRCRCVAIFTIAFLFGCQKEATQEVRQNTAQQAAVWEVIARGEMTPTVTAQLERAEAAKQALFTTLKARLMEVAGDEGPVAAIGVCSTEASEIAARVSQDHGLTIGRTSFRLRNSNNQPPTWAARFVDDRVDEPTFLVRELEFAALFPIRLQADCLLCHGDKESLIPSVAEAIAEHYPEDQATGFKTDDLRGWFWVEVPGPTEETPGDKPSKAK